MNAPAGYFVAPDANGEMWIWRERGRYPLPVIAHHGFRNDPDLWDAIVALVTEAAS